MALQSHALDPSSAAPIKYLPRRDWRHWGDFTLKGALPLSGMAVLTGTQFGWTAFVFPPLYPFALTRRFRVIDLKSISQVVVCRGTAGYDFSIHFRGDDKKLHVLTYTTRFPDQWLDAWATARIDVESASEMDRRPTLWDTYWWMIIEAVIFMGIPFIAQAWRLSGAILYIILCQTMFGAYVVYRESKRQ